MLRKLFSGTAFPSMTVRSAAMASMLIAAVLAFAPAPEAAHSHSSALDLRCYRLMAELAGSDDPQVSAAGLTGAQYFLGRIDARSPVMDKETAQGDATPDNAREKLIGRCSALMGDNGCDFRTIGQRLARPARTI